MGPRAPGAVLGDKGVVRVLEHVVVLGSGVAGLCAAAAAAPHARQVTLVERDHLADGDGDRPGVPQVRHTHALLARGSAELERLLPGLPAELRAAGALELDWTTQRFRSVMGWSPRHGSGLRSQLCTRALLEATLRARVAALPSVHTVDGAEAVGLVGDDARVTGVRLRRRPGRGGVGRDGDGDGGHGRPEELTADLVVDATGRGSRSPDMLAALGVPRPRESVVASHLGYASRVYARPERRDDWDLLAVRQALPSGRAAVLYPVEGDRWFVTLAGHGDDVPPHDEEGFAAYAAGVEGVAEALDGARPLTRIATYRRTENRWRHWERLRIWPDGVLVVGDATCAFNPVYGQGMTVAAVQARLLGAALGRPGWGEGDARRLQRRLAGVLRDPWRLATQEDFRYAGTVGRRSPATRLLHAYTDEVLRAATSDVAVSLRFFEVTHLLRPAAALGSPAMLVRVARGARAYRTSAFPLVGVRSGR